MRSLLSALVVLLALGFAVWLQRVCRRRVTNDPVSRRWLQNRRYERDGDDRLWK